jgi:chromosome segregation ATPase
MTRTKAQPTEAELRTTLATLRQGCAAARQRVLRLLAAGQDTADLRMEITAVERRISDIVALLAALATEREREEAAITSAAADRLATDAGADSTYFAEMSPGGVYR